MFTSSVNVAFSGTEVVEGTEHASSPGGLGGTAHLDTYSRCKAQAEDIVLAANGRLTADGTTRLKTCILRLAGVYGPHEQIIVGRTFRSLLNGCDMFSCFPEDVKVDFVHIDNAVQAHVKAGFYFRGTFFGME